MKCRQTLFGNNQNKSSLKRIVVFLLILVLLSVPVTPDVSSEFVSITTKPQLGAFTGAMLVQKLKDAAASIIERAGEQSKAAVNEAVTGLLRVAADLEKALRENVKKPLDELRKTFKEAIDRAEVALKQAEDFLNATRVCLANDFENLLAGFSGTLTYNVANAAFWASDEPLVYKVQRIDVQAPYGLRIGSTQTLRLLGANFNANDSCGVSASIIRIDGKYSEVKTKVVSRDPQSISLLVDPIKEAGTYKIRVSLGQKRKFLPGCGEAKVAQAVVAVLPKPQFVVSYAAKPFCSLKEERSFEVARVEGTNDKCDGDKYFENTGTLPDGWEYVGHKFYEQSNNGCEKQDDTYLGGTRVRVKYKCPEKGGILCSGPRKWIHGALVITGKRYVEKPSNEIQGKFTEVFTYGQTLTTTVAPSSCEAVSQWAVSITLVYPDGTVHNIPEAQGTGALTKAADGSSFIWNPATRSLSVTTPNNRCGGL